MKGLTALQISIPRMPRARVGFRVTTTLRRCVTNGRKTYYIVTLTNRLTMSDPALVANHIPHPLVNKAIRCDGMHGCKEMIVH
jgi:hypothetical protein